MNFTTYNRDEIKPGILHFGVGGFHRAHQANYLNQLMSQARRKSGASAGWASKSSRTSAPTNS